MSSSKHASQSPPDCIRNGRIRPRLREHHPAQRVVLAEVPGHQRDRAAPGLPRVADDHRDTGCPSPRARVALAVYVGPSISTTQPRRSAPARAPSGPARGPRRAPRRAGRPARRSSGRSRCRARPATAGTCRGRSRTRYGPTRSDSTTKYLVGRRGHSKSRNVRGWTLSAPSRPGARPPTTAHAGQGSSRSYTRIPVSSLPRLRSCSRITS